MAVTNGYATVAELREHFSDSGTTLDTELLERAINATSRSIDKYTGRRFWVDSTVQTRQYRPRENWHVFVDDISTTTGLIVATDTNGDGSYSTTWDTADYQLEPANADKDGAAYAWTALTAIDDKTFPVYRRRSLQVTAKFGWSAVPDDVNQACLIRAAAIFKRKEAPLGIAGFGQFGEIRITRRDPDVIELLAPFRRITKPDT